MRILVFLFLIQLFFTGSSLAQFSMNHFLNGARNDIRLMKNAEKSQFLEKNPYRSPLLHRTEFRARTNDFNFSPDDFRFRINPTNPFEIKANNDYYAVEFEYLLTEYQAGLNAALRDRYQLLLELIETESRRVLKQKQIEVLQEEKQILNLESDRLGFSVDDYISLRENQFQYRMELNDIQHNNELILLEIHNKHPFNGEIDIENLPLVSIAAIQNRINFSSPDQDTINNILVENRVQQNRLEEQRIRVEKAEARQNFGFLQAEYDTQRGDEFERHMGFQVGIRLPLTNADRPDLNRRRVDLIEEKADLAERKMEISLNCQLLRMELEFLLDQYSIIVREIEEYNVLDVLLKLPDPDPKDLLKAKRSLLKLKRMEVDTKWKIYNSYIDYLYFSGQLISLPLVNYLSPELDQI